MLHLHAREEQESRCKARTKETRIRTVDAYYSNGPFGGWVGQLPARVNGAPRFAELPVLCEDSEDRIEGVYRLDGVDTEGRPLYRWEPRVDPLPDPDED